MTDFLARLDPELRTAVEALPAMDLSGDLPALRAAMQAANAPLLEAMPEVPGVHAVDRHVPGLDGDPDVRVRVYERVERARPAAALVWVHGGGMVFGSVEGDDFMCRTWARKLGCVIVSVDYRLAPEHQHPAHVHDAYAALRWLSASVDELGIEPSRIVLGGASAGGGIAAGTALLARDRGEVALSHQLLVCPMIDDRDATPSTHDVTDQRVWNRDANVHGWRAYLGDRAGGDDVPIYAAPARATVDQLRGLPPAYIDVGELDPFRDEDIAYASKLLQAGVPCELHVTPGVYHGSESSVMDAESSRRIRAYRRAWMERTLKT
jgi:acetyl esterase/lipase